MVFRALKSSAEDFVTAHSGEAAAAKRGAPQTSVSIDWILAQTGELVDGSVASMKFRENIEGASVSLVELEAWALQALRPPVDRNRRHALQDLVHAVAKRLGLNVQYGSYERDSRRWLPFDGLWWLDARNYVCVNVHAQRLGKLELDQMLADLEGMQELGGVFGEARGTVVMVLADGYSAELEPSLRGRGALQSVRLVGIDTLFDIARMHAAGVVSSGQIPVLFSPFDSLRLGQVVDFLERFMARWEEPQEDLCEPATRTSGPSSSAGPRAGGPGFSEPSHERSGRDPERPSRTSHVHAPAALLERIASPIESAPASAAEAPHLRVVDGGVESPPELAAVQPEEVQAVVLNAVPAPPKRQRLETLREVYALFKAGRHPECVAELEKFLVTNENNPRAWEIYGDLSLKMGQHGEAIRAYGRALVLAPPSRAISFRLSGLYENLGDLREAVRVLEDYARAEPHGAREVRGAIARMLARAGDHSGAIGVCDQLMRDGPWDRNIVELREHCRRQLEGGRAKATRERQAKGLRGWVSSLLGSRR